MKYLIVEKYSKTLYIEDDKQCTSFYYHQKDKKWVHGGSDLLNARVGFDPYEDEGSPYAYGSSSSMADITEISKKEAEEFIGAKLNEKELKKMLGE